MVEEKVVDLILEALKKSNISTVSIHVESTLDYVNVVEDEYYTFCRIKLNGDEPYLGLGIGQADRKTLSKKVRFQDIELYKDKFIKFPLKSYQDVMDLSEEIVMAYKWSYPPGNKAELTFSDLEKQFIDGFKELLSARGFDPNLVEIDRKSDKTLNFCYGSSQFGRIKLQGRKTTMQVCKEGVAPPDWYENESYDFYEKNTERWVSYIGTFK